LAVSSAAALKHMTPALDAAGAEIRNFIHGHGGARRS